MENSLINGQTFLNHFVSFVICFVYVRLVFTFLKKKDFEKVNYSLFSCFNTLFLLVVLNNVNNEHWWIAILISVLIGVGREISQVILKKKEKINFLNIVADFIGSIAIIDVYIFSFLLVR